MRRFGGSKLDPNRTISEFDPCNYSPLLLAPFLVYIYQFKLPMQEQLFITTYIILELSLDLGPSCDIALINY